MTTDTEIRKTNENIDQQHARRSAARYQSENESASGDVSDAQRRNQPTITRLLTTLVGDASALVRGEAELAKAEMSEKISQAMGGLVFIIVSAAVLISGLTILLQAAVVGLSMILPPNLTPWLSTLIVGGAGVLLGLIMLLVGRSKLQARNLTPNRTIDSVNRDSQLIKEKTA